jgi:hypothetical protein
MGNYKTMKTRQLIIFLFFLPTISFGQNLSDSLLATFYNKTLSYYFSDSTTYHDQKIFGCILLKTEFDSSKLTKFIGPNRLSYFNSNSSEHSVLDKPLKKNKGRNIYWINHKLIGIDTVDINIGGWTIEEASRKKLYLAAWCGGTMGYIPDGRFIYDKPSDKWTFTTSREIIDQHNKRYSKCGYACSLKHLKSLYTFVLADS